jgi:hypothetical protein
MGVGQRDRVDRALDVAADGGAERRVGRPAGVVGRAHEAVGEAAAEVAHVPVPRVQQHQGALVAAVLPRVPGRPAHRLGQVGGEPLDVQRILARVRERVVQLRVGQAARVQRGGEGLESLLPARELIQRRSHHGSILKGIGAVGVDVGIGKL